MSATSGFEFDDLDATRDPDALMAYLDLTTAQRSVQEYKRRSFALLDLRRGFAVLDVGCGTGDDVRVLATQVGQEGRAVGLDSSEVAVAEARARSEEGKLGCEFYVGDAHQLPFDAGTFEATRTERVLQ